MTGEGTSEARYRAIVEDQPEMVCRFRRDGTLTFANRAYGRYFGRPPAELVGRRYAPVVHPEDRAAVEAALAMLTPARPVVSIENRVFRADEAVRCTQWTNDAIYDDRGRLVEIQATGRDITEQKAPRPTPPAGPEGSTDLSPAVAEDAADRPELGPLSEALVEDGIGALLPVPLVDHGRLVGGGDGGPPQGRVGCS